MDQLSSIAFAIALVGGMHDLLTRRIPNWLTLPGILLGLAAQGWFFGWAGLLSALAGLGIGTLLFFPIFALGYMGAGDVKLLMALGTWLGGRDCLRVAVISVLLGAAFALVEVVYRGRLIAVAKNIFYFLRALFVPGLVAEKLRLDESRKFAFGLCLAGAVATLIYFKQSGRFA